MKTTQSIKLACYEALKNTNLVTDCRSASLNFFSKAHIKECKNICKIIQAQSTTQ